MYSDIRKTALWEQAVFVINICMGMTKKSTNKNLHNANRAKKDEFYTQLSDIEKELGHYEKHFKDKTVLCNCDDPRVSNFFHYFS